ncbi:MAG: class I SAM-dependent methyltransferase [Anaerolineaceae bacterium]
MIYRNTNTLYKMNDVVGKVSDIAIRQGTVELTGKIDSQSIERFGLDQIILVDGKNRFIKADWLAQDGNWSITIDKSDIGNDNGYLDLEVCSTSKSMNFMFPLDIPQHIEKKYKKFIYNLLPRDSQNIPSFIDQYKKMIINAMNEPYIARSNFNSIPTGNNYQTIDLGDVEQKGGRLNRLKFLYQIDFQDKTVLDLGANTGENSRIVRRLGAKLVDGIEYDPYFVEIGRAINAVSGMTRVSLFQGDCTKPQEFEGKRYDIVLALAVWVYLQDTIKDVAEITDALVFETHTLDHGMEFYYEPVLKYFPYAVSLGYSDKPLDPHKSRMFAIFGKNQADIDTLIHRNFLKVKPYFKNLFIEKYNHLSKAEIVALSREFFDKHAKITEYDPDDYRFGRMIYCEVFLAGFHQYLNNAKSIDLENVFLKFLQKGVQKGIIDQGLTNVAEKPDWLLRKITNKYDDAFNVLNNNPDLIAPIELNHEESGKFTFETTSNEKIICNNIDGHHRFFMCELAGIEKVHYKMIEKNTALDQLIKHKEILKSNYTLEVKK